MDLQPLIQTLRQDALTVVFVNVMLQQLGLPVPVLPTLLLAGSLMATPGQLGRLLAAAVVASGGEGHGAGAWRASTVVCAKTA